MRTKCVTLDIFPGYPFFGPTFLRLENTEKTDIIPETLQEWENFTAFCGLLRIISEHAEKATVEAQAEIMHRFQEREKKHRQAIEAPAFALMSYLLLERQMRASISNEEKSVRERLEKTQFNEKQRMLSRNAIGAVAQPPKKPKEVTSCFCR